MYETQIHITPIAKKLGRYKKQLKTKFKSFASDLCFYWQQISEVFAWAYVITSFIWSRISSGEPHPILTEPFEDVPNHDTF